MRFEERTVFMATPDTVWRVLADLEGQSSWMPDVASIRVLGPRRELGARLAVKTRVFGLPFATDQIRVTAWDPPRRLAVEHISLVEGRGEWRLGEAPGGTRFTWLEDLLMPPPILGEMVLLLYSPWQRRMLRRSIENLRRIVEGGSDGLPA